MGDVIIDLAKEVVGYCEDGDLMTALSFYESEIRPAVEDLESHELQDLLDVMKSQAELVDNEEWQKVMENVDKMGTILRNNGHL